MNLVNAVKRCASATAQPVHNLAKRGRVIGAALVGGTTALVLAPTAHAAPVSIDTTEIVSTISGGVATVSAIGIAVISLVVVIKLFKWVQRVL